MYSINNKVDIKKSYDWIESSFKVFREKPVNFILLMLVNIIISFLPIFGSFFVPIFSAKYAQLTESILNNISIETFNFKTIFNNKSIMKLSLVSGLTSLLTMGNSLLSKSIILNSYISFSPFSLSIIINFLFYFIYMIIMMGMYFAPLICLHDQKISVFDALKLSFKAGLSNVIPLLFYLIIVIALIILGLVTLGLGLLIVIPVINISTYFIYKTILINNDSNL